MLYYIILAEFQISLQYIDSPLRGHVRALQANAARKRPDVAVGRGAEHEREKKQIYVYRYLYIIYFFSMIIIICPGLQLFVSRVPIYYTILCVYTYYAHGNLVSEHKRPPPYKEQPNGKKKKITLQKELMRFACVRGDLAIIRP